MTEALAGCRIDVWLWRARFFRTRSLSAAYVEEGRVRLSRGAQQTRLDKAARAVRSGDILIFAIGGRLHEVRVESCGVRRGSAAEARTLFSVLAESSVEAPGG